MKITHLKVSNFKKHQSFEADFDDHLTVVRGDNWAGKSTILHAILFALWGVSAVPGKKDQLPRRGGGKLSVELGLDLESGPVTLSRTLTAATVASAEGTLLATGVSAVDSWMQEQLGVDRKSALQLAYSPQSETAALLTLGVPALNRLVEQVSGADLIERVAIKASDRIKRLEGSLLDVEPVDHRAAIAGVEMDLGEAVRAAELAAIDEEASKGAADAAVEALNQAKLANQETAHALEQVELRERLTAQLGEALEAETSLAHQVKDLPEFDSDRQNNLMARRDGLLTLQARKAQARKDLAKVENWFLTTGAAWQELEPNIALRADRQGELDALEAGRAAIDARHTEASTASSAANKVLNDLLALQAGAACPTCKRPFEGHDPAEIEQEVAQAQLAKRQAAANLTKAIDERDEFEKALAALKLQISRLKLPPDDYEAVYAGQLEELSRLQAAVQADTHEGELAGVEAELSLLQKQAAARTQAVARHESAKDRVAHLREQVSQIVVDQTAASRQPADLKALDLAVREAREAVQEAAGRMASSRAKVSGLERQLAQLQAEQASHDRLVERNRQTETDLVEWKAFLSWLRASKTALLAELWDGILGQAGEFLSAATDGYATELVRSDDGEFSIVEDGEECSASAVSGGMRAIAATGLRLALADMLPTAPKFVLLDEVSAELNDENAGRLAAALAGYDRQVVMVTHRAGEEYLAGQVVTL